jgi:hypothetical protein
MEGLVGLQSVILASVLRGTDSNHSSITLIDHRKPFQKSSSWKDTVLLATRPDRQLQAARIDDI